MISISVADGLGLFIGDHEISLSNRRARAMLAYLAIEGGVNVSRERLAGLFWPDVDEHKARTSLRQAVFELRAALGSSADIILRHDHESVGLNLSTIELDLDVTIAQLGTGTAPESPLNLKTADRLLAGYEDISPTFAHWLAGTRRAAGDRMIEALEAVFERATLPARTRRAFAEACLRLDPTHEAACRAVMRLAATSGETSVALRAYSALYAALEDEMDTEPSGLTQSLVADIKRGMLDPSPGPVSNPRSRPRAASAFGGLPVVAVLPFRISGPDPDLAYLADGLVDDIVTILAGLREPVVISSASSQAYARTGAEPARLAEQLGAQYLLCGTVRGHSGIARISVELMEAKSAVVLWAHAYDVSTQTMLGTQDLIAANVAHILAPRVNAIELRRSQHFLPEELDTYHLLLRARELTYKLERGALAEAGAMLRRAVAIDPAYPQAHAALAGWHCLRLFQGWSPDRQADTAAVLAHAQATLRLDPSHPRMLALMAHIKMLTGRQFDEAFGLLKRALDAGPNDAETLIWSSPTYSWAGDGAEGVRRAERAIALSPSDPFMFRYEHFCSIAHYSAGDYAASAEYGLQSFQRNPNYTSNSRMTAAALAAMGRAGEARPMVESVAALEPDFRVGPWIERQAFRDARQRHAYGAHLLQAGLPP